MAHVSKEIVIESSADDVWEVIGDFAKGPSRMAPGLVVDTTADGDERTVTFADGTVVKEKRISLDHDVRRIAYSVVGGTVAPEHDNAAMQIVADGERRCRMVWTRDVLPDELAEPMGKAMAQGLTVIKKTLDEK
jgi:hypothetical protein